MSGFEDRQKGFEGKFAHDAEQKFKLVARRNKLLGLWAAEKLGKTGADAEAYAKEVVMSDLETAGDDDVVGKLLADFGAAGLPETAGGIRNQMDRLLPVAAKQLLEG